MEDNSLQDQAPKGDRSRRNDFPLRDGLPSQPDPAAPDSATQIDVGPWVGADPDDQSPGADFRREVARLMKDVLGRGSKQEEAGAALSPGHFDVRAETPALLLAAVGALNRRMARQRGRRRRARMDERAVRDLLLVEIARRTETSPLLLRRALGLSRSTLSRALARAGADGLLTRRRHPADGRTWLLSLTDPGLREAAEVVDVWRSADEALLAELTPAERETLRRLLRATRRSLGGAR